jgi:prepilin-type N-terminal cleavage/methylation domain-containing protein/prepilin-type processing-associated H-X9-DG protein
MREPDGRTRPDCEDQASAMRAAFTLIELLVVVAIISLLMALLLPAIGAIRERALRAGCLGNMRTIGSAAMSWAADHDGVMEGGYSYLGNDAGSERRAWMDYLANPDDPYMTPTIDGQGRHLRCTKNEDGWYGMYNVSRGVNDPTRTNVGPCPATSDTTWIRRYVPGRDWPLNPGYVGGVRVTFRPTAGPKPANTLFLTCTSRGNQPHFFDRGMWFFTTDGPWQFNTTHEGAGIWMAHGDNAANGVFFDGHAATVTPDELLNVENHPPCQDVKGVRVWKSQDGNKVEDGVEVL